jgi:hypothetical protein
VCESAEQRGWLRMGSLKYGPSGTESRPVPSIGVQLPEAGTESRQTPSERSERPARLRIRHATVFRCAR